MLDVHENRQIQAALLSLKQADRELRKDVNKDVRGQLNPVWKEALLGRVERKLDVRIIHQGARVAVGTRQITLHAATSKRALEGGLVPSANWAAEEMGMVRRKKTFTATNSRGKSYKVTRMQGAQFPRRTNKGRVAFPAAAVVIKESIPIWLRTIVSHYQSFATIKGK